MLTNKKIGFALTGSFCTFSKVILQIEALVKLGANVIPIMSEFSYSTDTRFGKACDFIEKIENMTGKKIIHTIKDAEPIGPKNLLDIMVIAPCSGNTLSKIANGMTDTCVVMAAKASLRNSIPLVIAVSTNDGLSMSAKNLAAVLNMKNVYLVPFRQDNHASKPNSLVADMSLIPLTIENALLEKQIQPILKI